MTSRTRRLQRVLLGPQDQDVRRLRVRIQLWLTTLLVARVLRPALVSMTRVAGAT